MKLKDINDMGIPTMAKAAERRIIDTINLLDAILYEAKPQNREAESDVDSIGVLCDTIVRAYDKAKSSLNEMQQE